MHPFIVHRRRDCFELVCEFMKEGTSLRAIHERREIARIGRNAS
jgi:hypothetical protein